MSVQSMTGFSHSKFKTQIGDLSVELKSVNSRFLELSIRLPDELKAYESEIRSLISSHVRRGKVECRIQKLSETATDLELNVSKIEDLKKVENQLQGVFKEAVPLSISDILQFPGVMIPKGVDAELMKTEVLQGLGFGVGLFLKSRLNEGQALSKVLQGYCNEIERLVGDLQPKLPRYLDVLKEKLTLRLQEALNKTLTDKSYLASEEVVDRIRQEVLLYAIKMDVDEEMVRLLTHVSEIRRILSSENEVGKRLDFLIQELNREANTLGSKAVAIDMTDCSVSLKVIIEKMREQVQNLE